MTTKEQVREWIGHDAIDVDGDKIGTVDAVYVDDTTGDPEWFAVKTGWFGSHVSLVPIEGTRADDDRLVVPFDKDRVKDAPHMDPEGHISSEEERELYAYYGISGDGGRTTGTAGTTTPGTTTRGTAGERPTTGTTTGRTTGDRDAMTRSEEDVKVGTTERPRGRARLRKWVETEHVQKTVPVRKEHAEVVTEPITDENRDAAMSGQNLTEDAHEMTLMEEEAVVEKRTVPKERVRLEKETEVEQETVDADVRKERIEAEGDVENRRRR